MLCNEHWGVKTVQSFEEKKKRKRGQCQEWDHVDAWHRKPNNSASYQSSPKLFLRPRKSFMTLLILVFFFFKIILIWKKAGESLAGLLHLLTLIFVVAAVQPFTYTRSSVTCNALLLYYPHQHEISILRIYFRESLLQTLYCIWI